MEFVKMEGLGNDFVVIDGAAPSPAEVEAWCDRRRGIGADGVLRVTPSRTPGAAIRMQYWNADGSPAEMCGNGLRCAARFGFDRGLTAGRQFRIETAVGVNEATILEGERVRVELGAFAVGSAVVLGGTAYRRAVVGNPHAVAIVDDPEVAPVTTAGPRVETDPAFPDGTNVEFAAVDDAGVRLRVWERGVGETLACGTGAAAALAVAHAEGRIGRRAPVRLRGGTLEVELEGEVAFITGPARYVFRGEWAR